MEKRRNHPVGDPAGAKPASVAAPRRAKAADAEASHAKTGGAQASAPKADDSVAGRDSLDVRLKRVALVACWMLVVGGAVWGLVLLGPFLTWVGRCAAPFAMALVVAYVFYPIVTLAEKRLHVGRVAGIFAVALLIVLLVGGFFGLLVPVLWEQGAHFVQAVRDETPNVLERIRGWSHSPDVSAQLDRLIAWFKGLDVDLPALAQQALGKAPQFTEGGVLAVGSALFAMGGMVLGIGGFVSSAVLVLMIAFYLLAEFDAIPRFVRLVLPLHHEERTMTVLGRVNASLSGYLRGQLTVCALMAVLASLGLWLIGMRQYAVLVGVLAGLANLVPYLGPVVGATPAVLWALLTTDHATWGERLLSAAFVVALFATIQSLDGFVFQPRIVGRASHLHPLAVIAALIVGSQFGLPGLILALPLACVARVLILELWWEPHMARRQAEKRGAKP
jgi:predicted PurR-regulated permease PerM